MKELDLKKFLPKDFHDIEQGISHIVVMHNSRGEGHGHPDENRAQMELQSPDELHSELPRHPLDSMFEGAESALDDKLEAEPRNIQELEDNQMEEESVLNRLGKNPHANKMTRFSLKNEMPKGPHLPEMMRKGKKGKY